MRRIWAKRAWIGAGVFVEHRVVIGIEGFMAIEIAHDVVIGEVVVVIQVTCETEGIGHTIFGNRHGEGLSGV